MWKWVDEDASHFWYKNTELGFMPRLNASYREGKKAKVKIFIMGDLKALRKSARCGPSAGSSLSIRRAFHCCIFQEREGNDVMVHHDQMNSPAEI